MPQVKKKADFTDGKLFLPLLLFSLPIIATGVLQLLYNMADQIVVGQFSGDANALAAVGSTSSLVHLIVNFLIGISAGTSVMIAQTYGAKQYDRVNAAVHTSLAFALIGGIAVGAVGFFAARPLLVLMGTKAEILEMAALYVKITVCGLPGAAIYNFGAAILRSVGNSKTPLLILASTGVVNVLLNLVFVIVFHMSVAGVALATIIAQYLSAAVVVFVLMRANGPHRFSFKKARIELRALGTILRIGMPSAVQSCLFSFSNVIIQSAVNTFPTTTISGFTVALSVEGITFTAMNSFHQSTVTFVGQNYGAHKPKRLRRILWYAVLQVALVGLSIGYLELLFAEPLSSLFVDMSLPEAPAIVAAAGERMRVILGTYFLCGIMEVLTGYLRGMGYSLVPMISCVFGVCALRIFWVLVLFPLDAFHSVAGLLLSFPVSWLVVILFHSCTILYSRRKVRLL
jgi:putative MATE family efflux protein